jgi:hypothetical protein
MRALSPDTEVQIVRTHRLLSSVAAISCLALSASAGATVSADRNGDDIPDGWERKHHLTLVGGQGGKDQDRDGLSNWAEWRAGTNPRRRDSDRDGRPDGREDRDHDGLGNRFEARTGHDPRDPDTNDDGTKDGREGAGRVTAVKGLFVTVDLGGGRRLKGRLSEDLIEDCATAGDWLAGPSPHDRDEPAGASRPAGGIPGAEDVADDARDTVEDLLPSLRTVGDDDGEDDSGEPAADAADDSVDDAADDRSDDPADDAADDSDDDAADGRGRGSDDAEPADIAPCPDGVVRRGTWLHGSEVEGGQLTWLAVVLND